MGRVSVRQVNAGLGVTLLLLLLNAVISYCNILKLIDNQRLVSQNHQALAALEKVLSTLKDAETGQRGYLLTGKDRYLEPYNASLSQINQQLQTLQQLEISPPQQQIQGLEQAIKVKLTELAQTIQLRRNQGFNAALQIVESGRGKRIMDSIRQQITRIEQQENQQLNQRLQESQQSLTATLLTFTLLSGASLLLLGFVAATLRSNEKQRHQAEQTLQEREERLRLFVQYAPVSVAMFDKRMHYLAVSQRWINDYHLDSIEAVLGKSHYAIFPNIPAYWRTVHQLGLAGQSEKCDEDRFVLPDGSEQYLRWEVQPWFDGSGSVNGILIFVEDITARKVTEIALRESEQQFKATFNQAAVGIAHVAPTGTWRQVNGKLCEIVGYTEGELLQRTFQDITHPEDLDKDLMYFHQMLAGEIQTYAIEKRYLRKDESIVWINLTVSLVRGQQGEPNYFISVVEDITERKQAAEQIQASLQEKEVLLKEIHHRVKNNLQIISSLLNLQSAELQNSQDLELFQVSQKRIESMALIHEKLYQSPDLGRIDFAEYIQDLVQGAFCSYEVNSDAVSWKLNIEPVLLGIDAAIPCGLIINELLLNSLKHAFPGGRSGEIWIKLRQDSQNQIILTSGDNGIGFPENLDFKNTSSLGLQLVNALTEQLKGTVELNRSSGVEFKITFPIGKH